MLQLATVLRQTGARTHTHTQMAALHSSQTAARSSQSAKCTVSSSKAWEARNLALSVFVHAPRVLSPRQYNAFQPAS